MIGWARVIHIPGQRMTVEIRPFAEINCPLHWPRSSMPLSRPDASRVQEFSFPDHRHTHLFGVKSEIDSAGVADADATFSNPRLAATQHFCFVGYHDFKAFSDNAARHSCLAAID